MKTKTLECADIFVDYICVTKCFQRNFCEAKTGYSNALFVGTRPHACAIARAGVH